LMRLSALTTEVSKSAGNTREIIFKITIARAKINTT